MEINIDRILILVVDWLVRLFIFKQISGIKLEFRKIFFFLLPLVIIEEINQEFSLFLEPLYLLLITLLIFRPKWKLSQYIFYSFTPFVIVDLFQRITGIYAAKFISVDVNFNDMSIIFVLFSLFIFLPVYFFFVKMIRFDFKNISKIFYNKVFQHIILVINTSMILYCSIIHTLFIVDNMNHENILNIAFNHFNIEVDIVKTYLVFLMACMIYMNYKAREQQDYELKLAKEQQIKSMSDYSKYIESLYKEIRSFRHDYTNILVSLNEAIKQEDMLKIKTIYHQVIAGSDDKFQNSKYDIAELSNIKNDAVKSVLSAKLIEAQNKGIDLGVEIEFPIDVPNMELVDFIIILSIFLDNAIEAAADSENRFLSIAYFEENSQKILIIENSTKQEQVNTRAIFHYEYSSKGENRGIGLMNVKEILANYPYISLKTRSHHYQFIQELRIPDSIQR